MNPGEAVTREHLEALRDRGGPSRGEAVLARTGWGHGGPAPTTPEPRTGSPGSTSTRLATTAAEEWCSSVPTPIAVEQITAEHGLTRLPVHRHLLGERGINLLEGACTPP